MRLKFLGAAASFFLALALLGGASASEVKLLGRELQGSLTAGAWKHVYDSHLGALRGPVQTAEAIYLGVGPVVFAYNERGEVLARYDLSAPVVSLDGSGGVLRVTVAGVGYREIFSLNSPSEGGTRERTVFAPNPSVTLWTEQYAASLRKDELAKAWQNDPQNAFLGLRLALESTPDREKQQQILIDVLNTKQSFAVWTRLAVLLDEANFSAEANNALHKARQDAAERGYHPLFRVSNEALKAYGDPAAHALRLQAAGEHERATRWAEHLRQLHPRNDHSQLVFRQHLAHLKTTDQKEEIARWESILQQQAQGTLYRWGSDATERLEETSDFAGMALFIAILLAVLILGNLKKTRRPERLTVVAMAIVLCWLHLGALWAEQQKEILSHPALNLGTHGGAWQKANLPEALPGSPEAALQRGVAAQLSGELSTARKAYSAAEHLSCARNNLGVVASQMGHRPFAENWYRSAEGLPEAAHNLGKAANSESIAFHKQHFPEAAALCLPSDLQLMQAFGKKASSLFLEHHSPANLIDLKEEWASGSGGSPRLRLLFSEMVLLLTLFWMAMPDRMRRSTDLRKKRILPMHNPWSGVLLFCTVAATRSATMFCFALLGWAAVFFIDFYKRNEETAN